MPFISANLSEKAEGHGASILSLPGVRWYYFLRSACIEQENYKSDEVVGMSGYVAFMHMHVDIDNNGLRVAIQLKYNKDSAIFDSLHKVKQESLVDYGYLKNILTILGLQQIREKSVYSISSIEVCGEVPCIVYGGKEYIWLNKEECESGLSKTMKCWSLELLNRAVPFDKKGKNNDYSKAIELHKQCHNLVTENCTKEELDMLVKVKISDKEIYHDYENVEPLLN